MKPIKPFRLSKKILTAMTLLILISFFIAACEQKRSDPFPSALEGTWVTQESRHKNRYLEISNTQIIFGTGEHEPNIFFIDRIKKINQVSTTEWTFFCQDIEGNLFEIVIFYKAGTDRASIRLKNKEKIIWYKIEE